MPKQPNLVELLIATVFEHSIDEPIVPSATVRWVLDERLGERRNHPEATRNGSDFERADHEACSRGRLQKWKRRIGQGGIGWSASQEADAAAYRRAEEWAERKGWRRH